MQSRLGPAVYKNMKLYAHKAILISIVHFQVNPVYSPCRPRAVPVPLILSLAHFPNVCKPSKQTNLLYTSDGKDYLCNML